MPTIKGITMKTPTKSFFVLKPKDPKEGYFQALMNKGHQKWIDNPEMMYSGKPMRSFLQNRRTSYKMQTPLERDAMVLGHLNYQITNGGIGQWRFNGYSASERTYVLRALDKMPQTPVVTEIKSVLDEIKSVRKDRWLKPYNQRFFKVSDQFVKEAEIHFKKRVRAGEM